MREREFKQLMRRLKKYNKNNYRQSIMNKENSIAGTKERGNQETFLKITCLKYTKTMRN